MTMITPSYLGETIEYSSLHACRSTLEDPTFDTIQATALQAVALGTMGGRCYMDAADLPAPPTAAATTPVAPDSCAGLTASSMTVIANLIATATANEQVDVSSYPDTPGVSLAQGDLADLQIAGAALVLPLPDSATGADPATALALEDGFHGVTNLLLDGIIRGAPGAANLGSSGGRAAFEVQEQAIEQLVVLEIAAARCVMGPVVAEARPPLPGNASLTTSCSDTPCTQKSTVTVSFTNMPGYAGDYVSIGAADTTSEYAQSKPTGSVVAGTVSFTGLPAGVPLVARAYPDGSTTLLLAPSAQFTLEDRMRAIGVRCAPTCTTSDDVVVDFAGLPGYGLDWMAAVADGQPDARSGSWRYVDPSHQGGVNDGSLDLGTLPLGHYVIQAFHNDGYSVDVASAGFTVAAPGSMPVIGGGPPGGSCATPTPALCLNPDYVHNCNDQGTQTTCQGFWDQSTDSTRTRVVLPASMSNAGAHVPALTTAYDANDIKMRSSTFGLFTEFRHPTSLGRAGANPAVAFLRPGPTEPIHPDWETDGLAVNSCEEYAYKKFYDYNRFLDAARAYGNDFDSVVFAAYDGDPSQGLRPIGQPPLQRKAENVAIAPAAHADPDAVGTIQTIDSLVAGSFGQNPFMLDANTLSFLKAAPYAQLAPHVDPADVDARRVTYNTNLPAVSELQWHKIAFDELRAMGDARPSSFEQDDIDRRVDHFAKMLNRYLGLLQMEAAIRNGSVHTIPIDTRYGGAPVEYTAPDPWKGIRESFGLIQALGPTELTTVLAPSGTLSGQTFFTESLVTKSTSTFQLAPGTTASRVNDQILRPGALKDCAEDPCTDDDFRTQIAVALEDEITRTPSQYGCLDPYAAPYCTWSARKFVQRMTHLEYVDDAQLDYQYCRHVSGGKPARLQNATPSVEKLEAALRLVKAGADELKRKTSAPPEDFGGAVISNAFGKRSHDAHSMGSDIFGAAYTYDAGWYITVDPNTSTNCQMGGKVYAGATANATIFTQDIPLVDTYSEVLHNAGDSGFNVKSHTKVVSIPSFTLEDLYAPIDEYHSGQYNPDPLEGPTFTIIDVKMPFAVGPIPMSIGFSGAASSGANIGATVMPGNACGANPQALGLTGTFAPWISADVTASLAVDLVIASAGVDAQVNLLTLSLPLTMTAGMDSQSNFDITTDLSLQTEELSGSVNAFAEIDLPFYHPRWELTIFRWDGLTQQTSLFHADAKVPVASVPLAASDTP